MINIHAQTILLVLFYIKVNFHIEVKFNQITLCFILLFHVFQLHNHIDLLTSKTWKTLGAVFKRHMSISQHSRASDRGLSWGEIVPIINTLPDQVHCHLNLKMLKHNKSKENEQNKNILTTDFNSVEFEELIYSNWEQLSNLKEIISDSTHCNFKVTVFSKGYYIIDSWDFSQSCSIANKQFELRFIYNSVMSGAMKEIFIYLADFIETCIYEILILYLLCIMRTQE